MIMIISINFTDSKLDYLLVQVRVKDCLFPLKVYPAAVQ